MSKINSVLNRLENIEKSLKIISKTEKIKCKSCYRERYAVEYHNHMLSDSVKKKVCKICVNRRNRERVKSEI
jgi:hypothetical protein